MRRRDFLDKTVAAAAVLASSPLLAADQAPRRIPIGFLGVTYPHAPDKVRLVTSSADWDFVGVCDGSAAGGQVCKDLGARVVSREELFGRATVVVVESEPRDHATHAMLALRAGKHVHLEKPPVTALADMQAIVALAREKGLLLQVGFMWRYNPGVQKLFEAVRRGWLGDVFLVRGMIGSKLAPAQRPDWAQYGGGSMFLLGCHLVDMTVRLLGKPRSVTPFLRHQGKSEDTLKDNNVALLEYGGATAVLVNTALQQGSAPQRSFEVYGTKGTAILQPIEPPTLKLELGSPAGPYHEGIQLVSLPAYRRYEGDFAELAAAVRGEKPLSVSLDQELLVAETLLRASDML
jgi:predicted dehydrogenase